MNSTSSFHHSGKRCSIFIFTKPKCSVLLPTSHPSTLEPSGDKCFPLSRTLSRNPAYTEQLCYSQHTPAQRRYPRRFRTHRSGRSDLKQSIQAGGAAAGPSDNENPNERSESRADENRRSPLKSGPLYEPPLRMRNKMTTDCASASSRKREKQE